MHPSRLPPPWLAATALVGILGCDSQRERPANFGYIQAAILTPNCATASCHSEAQSEEDLDFSNFDRAYRSLTGVDCGADDPSLYVNVNKPERSAVLTIMRSTGGERMPPDVGLPEEEIALIERWITEGAPCD